jgi:hypothetical protein
MSTLRAMAAALFIACFASALFAQTSKNGLAEDNRSIRTVESIGEVWLAHQDGWHEFGDKRWYWNNIELRREGGPTFLLCVYSSQLVDAQNQPGCIFVFDTADAFWLLSNVQTRAQWHDIETQGRFRGMRTPEFHISFSQHLEKDEMEKYSIDERVSFVFYENTETPEKEEAEFSIENGRVFHVRWNEARSGLECCQLQIDTPAESLIRTVEGLVHSDVDKYAAFNKWWIESQPGSLHFR